jgi:hypothetical protein
MIQFIPVLREIVLILLKRNETDKDGKYNIIDALPNGWRFNTAGPNSRPGKHLVNNIYLPLYSIFN